MFKNKHPILYSFRRCPYAMRARLALQASGILVEIREIKLQNKPDELLQSSPKGTVPVLVLNSQEVLDESLDIIWWALKISDPKNWLAKGQMDQAEINKTLTTLEYDFKQNLDKYKYPNRYTNINKNLCRDKNLKFLNDLNDLLKRNKALNNSHLSMVDYAIFPFIRQFRNVDEQWFDSLDFKFLKKWLYQIIDSKQFLTIMKKYKLWKPNQIPIYTNFSS
jgi:glutathione S-transferase